MSDVLESYRLEKVEQRVDKVESKLDSILFGVYGQVVLAAGALVWRLLTNGGHL